MAKAIFFDPEVERALTTGKSVTRKLVAKGVARVGGEVSWSSDGPLEFTFAVLGDAEGPIAHYYDGAWHFEAARLAAPLENFSESKAWRFGGEYGRV